MSCIKFNNTVEQNWVRGTRKSSCLFFRVHIFGRIMPILCPLFPGRRLGAASALATPVEPPTRNIDWETLGCMAHQSLDLDFIIVWHGRLSSLAKQSELLKMLVHTGVAVALAGWEHSAAAPAQHGGPDPRDLPSVSRPLLLAIDMRA